MPLRALRYLAVVFLLPSLSGCEMVLLSPSGYVAQQQSDLMIAATLLMLLIVVPVLVATFVIAYRYRRSNAKSSYAPTWAHSTKLELLIWAAPLAIIVMLGAMTWISTHVLDPFAPLSVEAIEQSPLPEQHAPLQIDVVALNWKWLFLYPDYGIATVGEVAAPVGVPIRFRITASDIMNSFFIPAIAGQIYAMPGMRTVLSAVANETGTFKGMSSNYSGEGFNYMDFRFLSLTREDFAQWVGRVQSSDKQLTRKRYLELAEPSIDVPVTLYSDYADPLFRKIVKRCFVVDYACGPGAPEHHEAAAAHHMTASAAGEEPIASATSH